MLSSTFLLGLALLVSPSEDASVDANETPATPEPEVSDRKSKRVARRAALRDVDGDAGLLVPKEHAVTLAAGVDYSVLTADLSYRYGIDLGRDAPLTLQFGFATPVFVGPRDLRARAGASHAFKFGEHFALVPSVEPFVLRTVNNDVQKMVSLGSTVGFTAGFVGPLINVGAAANFDVAWGTHIRHTDIYRDQVYAEVEDGWYRTPASNVRLGVHFVGRIRRLELGLDGGISRTGRFRPYLLVPSLYANVFATWRW